MLFLNREQQTFAIPGYGILRNKPDGFVVFSQQAESSSFARPSSGYYPWIMIQTDGFVVGLDRLLIPA